MNRPTLLTFVAFASAAAFLSIGCSSADDGRDTDSTRGELGRSDKPAASSEGNSQKPIPAPEVCGPGSCVLPAYPAVMCSDGKTWAGPTGRCIAAPKKTADEPTNCVAEIRECPPEPKPSK